MTFKRPLHSHSSWVPDDSSLCSSPKRGSNMYASQLHSLHENGTSGHGGYFHTMLMHEYWWLSLTMGLLTLLLIFYLLDYSYPTNNRVQNLAGRNNSRHATSLYHVGRPSPTQLFALIIGIDDYTNCQKLCGAVADAKAIKRYLKEALQVSEDHIIALYDHEATRNAVIMAFKDLRNDQRINYGDPIVIFYAGHGGELPAPSIWGLESKIQCLLPQNYNATSTNPIPDRTIGALIEDIAKVKGDNITVIFDCCYSASGTRAQDGEYVPRTVYLDPNIPTTLDKDIWGSRAGSIPGGFAHHGLRSHVLLAACGEKELAYEHEGRGQFTSALLATLRNYAINDLTYTQLLDRIHLTKQNPQCEGFNRHRVLFSTRVSAAGGRQVFYPVQADHGKFVIGAGLAHGVSHGVEFTLYCDRKFMLGAIAVTEISSINAFETTVPTSLQLTNVSFAKLTCVGKVPLYLSPGGNYLVLKEAFRQMHGNGALAPKFRVVGKVEDAKLEVVMENDLAIFKILDQQVKSFGLEELPYKVTLDNLARVLDAAAHFSWYLDHKNKNNSIGANHEVAVDFYLLKTEYDDYGLPLLYPVEPGFCRKDPTRNSDNSDVIDFVVDPDASYGIKITNNTPRDLYLNAFLFNYSDLSIDAHYTQSSAGKPEVPLKQGGTFTLGYGPGGTTPFSYSLEASQDVDVGYLKIFFATQPIDLSDVVQMSPFSNMNMHSQLEPKGDPRVSRAKPDSEPRSARDIWFNILVPVVQRRKGMDAVV